MKSDEYFQQFTTRFIRDKEEQIRRKSTINGESNAALVSSVCLFKKIIRKTTIKMLRKLFILLALFAMLYAAGKAKSANKSIQLFNL